MTSTKSRGRPSATQITEASSSTLISNIATTITAQTSALHQQYVGTSLLKIESVVPTRLNVNRNHQQRSSRLITRSYSTLCGPAVAAASPLTFANGTVNYKNVTKKINTNLHRHKNLRQQQRLESGNGHESPTGKINNSQTSDTSCLIVENGVHKIRRTSKEKDKQPDRINLDRRGLCTIPVIDSEPSLRLLSLQHNLINTFHIPDSEVTTADAADGVKDSNNNVPSKDVDKVNGNQQAPIAAIINKSTKPFLKQKSVSRNQLNLNFAANANTNGNGTSNGTATSPSPFLQKSFMFQSKGGLLKRANSVMINYSPTPTSAVTAVQSTIFGTAQRSKLVATPSFSVIDTHTHHEMANVNVISKAATPDIQIDVNNSYLNSFRFNLTNLVFLDLYNNQIEKISNLDGLKSLTVLLLGKNRISDISGLISLKQTLRVLDLHGNRITHITQKICQLQELKSLNLAGNMLRQINATDFAGLCCLKELNLKRNRIKKINVSDDLHNLERLWLCHNELQNIEDMSSIAKSINLKEITIENNPLAGDCVSFLVSYLPLLNSLNQLQITEQVRRAANAWRRSKENTDQNFQHLSTDVSSSIRREEIISNARTNWELIRHSNISNGTQRQSNHVKKNIKTPKLTPNNSSSSTSTTSSSNVNMENGKARNSSRQMIDVAKRSHPKLLRSLSAENSSPVVSEKDTDEEFFHLPPVLGCFTKDQPAKNQSAASSTRPNVDSESSAFSSDNDDHKSFKSRVPTTPPIQPSFTSKPPSPIEMIVRENESGEIVERFTPPPLPPVLIEPVASDIVVLENCFETLRKDDLVKDETFVQTPLVSREREKEQKATLTIVDNFNGISLQPTINVESESGKSKPFQPSDTKPEATETDKLSIISKTSAKTSSESINTLSFATEERQVHSSQTNYHPRNRSGSRKLGPPLVRSQTARNLSSHLNNQQIGANNQSGNQKKETKKETDKDREQGGDYLVEILGRYLNVYGVGAIKFVDKQWNAQKAQDVHTVKFSYINFNSISPILGRIKVRFPNVENYVFRETNIVCLGQLNGMADTQGLKSITIDPEGNPLANKNWRPYAIYRLNHWGLKQINGVEISDDEICEAENTFGGLSDLVLWSLPDSLLQPLFTRLRVDEVVLNNKMTPKEWLLKHADESIRQVVGKEALQWKKLTASQDELVIRRKGKVHFSSMMENTVNAVEKLQKLEYLWPNILLEMIRNTLIDFSQIDLYVRNLMSEVLKENN